MANPAKIEQYQASINLGRSLEYYSYISNNVYVLNTIWGKISNEIEDISIVQHTAGFVGVRRLTQSRTYVTRFVYPFGSGTRDLIVDGGIVYNVLSRSEIMRERFMLVETELSRNQDIPQPDTLITKAEYRLNYAGKH